MYSTAYFRTEKMNVSKFIYFVVASKTDKSMFSVNIKRDFQEGLCDQINIAISTLNL